MAVGTGFSKPYIGVYTNNGGTVTYANGMDLGRGVSVELSVESNNDNKFYADNRLAESESGNFTSGEVTVTIDGLAPDAARAVLGLPEATSETVGGSSVNVQAYGAQLDPPYVGFGYLRRVMQNGVTSWVPCVLTKCKFGLAGESASTSEDSISWQTQELTATVQIDDTAAGNWRKVYAAQTSEAAAYAILTAVLGGATKK